MTGQNRLGLTRNKFYLQKLILAAWSTALVVIESYSIFHLPLQVYSFPLHYNSGSSNHFEHKKVQQWWTHGGGGHPLPQLFTDILKNG